MTDHTGMPRRTVLAGAGALAGAAALAACSSDSGGSAAPAATSGGQGAPATSGSAPGAVAQLGQIPVGQAVAAKDASGRPIVVAQPQAGTAVAFSAICTHMGCTVAPAGTQLKCPCHGSVFEAATGQVVDGPAARALTPVAVHVAGNQVVLGSA